MCNQLPPACGRATNLAPLTSKLYLFTHLPTDETVSALLQFGDRYLESTTGDVPSQQFLETL